MITSDSLRIIHTQKEAEKRENAEIKQVLQSEAHTRVKKWLNTLLLDAGKGSQSFKAGPLYLFV